MDELPAPLIVTAALDDEATALFDDLRRRYFPPARNVLTAHLTLFHHLPGATEQAIASDLSAVTGEHGTIPVEVSGVRNLGRGVAYDIASAELVALRQELAQRWWDDLGGQDRTWSRPHVTVSNKISPAEASALQAELVADFSPWTATVDHLVLWRYLGGPWEHVSDHPLRPGPRG